MRLWHKDLIPVLPRKQLLGQWRECCLIAKHIAEKGTPNHILVNKIMDYTLNHFYNYGMLVAVEMDKRGYECTFEKFSNYFTYPHETGFIFKNEIFKHWHTHRYLKQCLYNLEEKYDCGGISREEWIPIYDKFHYKNN